MLDKQAFADSLEWLAERFHRDVPTRMIRSYYEMLSPHLTTEQFQGAARTVYFEDQFWPAPARFLELVGSDASSRAQDAWELVRSEALDGNLMNARKDWPAEIAKALKYIGGLKAIAHCANSDLPHVERRFRKALETIYERGSLPELDKPEAPELPGVWS